MQCRVNVYVRATKGRLRGPVRPEETNVAVSVAVSARSTAGTTANAKVKLTQQQDM
jgi:hypothetical protein